MSVFLIIVFAEGERRQGLQHGLRGPGERRFAGGLHEVAARAALSGPVHTAVGIARRASSAAGSERLSIRRPEGTAGGQRRRLLQGLKITQVTLRTPFFF